jgi:hypothetical protein
MQFVMPALVLGANYYNIDGTEHVSLSVMECDPSDKSLKGYRPAKIKCAAVVFDQVADELSEYPKQLDLIVINKVSGGKVAQTCIGISKPAKGPATNSGAQAPQAKAV